MNAIIRIRDKIDLAIKRNGAEDTFLFFLFSQVRVILEKKKQKINYPHLSMVCDWYLHSEIDRSKEGYKIIEKIGKLIINNITNTDTENLIRGISRTFGMNKLKNELKDFFVSYKINTIIVEDKNWERVIINIANDLKDIPIKIPEKTKTYKNMYESLETIAKEGKVANWEKVIPIGISIYLKDNAFFWNVEMNSGINITGALLKS